MGKRALIRVLLEETEDWKDLAADHTDQDAIRMRELAEDVESAIRLYKPWYRHKNSYREKRKLYG